MAKKKDKPQVINNIKELNLEIDYDKLAEAMVKVQGNTSNEYAKSKYLSAALVSLISIAFKGVAIALLPTIIIMVIAIQNVAITTMQWDGVLSIIGNIAMLAIFALFAFVMGIFAKLLWKSAKELENERDRNYIISVFSGIVSFAALIVALVALFKGVG